MIRKQPDNLAGVLPDGSARSVEPSVAPVIVDGDIQTMEADALARCRAGERDAFHVLVSAHERSVAAVVSRIVPHRQEAEDLVQETFIQAYCKLDTFRGDSSFGTWLHRIAVNLSVRRLRQLRARGWTPIEDLERVNAPELRGDVALPEREAMRKEEKAFLGRALGRLTDDHRIVVTLHYFDGRSCPEIAELLGCSVGTVWSRLHYAMKKLRKMMDTEMER